MTLYITDEDLKEWLSLPAGDVLDDARVAAANAGAKRGIDLWLGRNFDLHDGAATDRYYHPGVDCHVVLDDCTEITAIATDNAQDGTWSTSWAATDWYLAPVGGVGPNGAAGWAYTDLYACEARYFTKTVRPSVKATGKWGWAAVPDDIALAQRLYGAELFKMSEAPLGTSWGEGGGADSIIRQNRPLRDLLSPYKRARAGESRFMVA